MDELQVGRVGEGLVSNCRVFERCCWWLKYRVVCRLLAWLGFGVSCNLWLVDGSVCEP